MLYVLLVILLCGAAQAEESLPECPEEPANNRLAQQIVDKIESLRPLLKTGIPEKGIPPLDPFKFLQSIPMDVSNELITLEGSIDGATVYNLAKFIICELTIDIGFSPKFKMDVRLDELLVNGSYHMEGSFAEIQEINEAGDFRMDLQKVGFLTSATANYAILSGTLSIKDLKIDISFEELEIYFDSIPDVYNELLSDAAKDLFNELWEKSQPMLEDFLETQINEILENLSISDFIPPRQLRYLAEANEE